MPVNRAGRLLGRRVLAAAGLLFACLFIWPATAPAEFFTVDTAADEADATLGSEGCLTAGGKCSLRAALEEANFSGGEFDEVEFSAEPFAGDGGSVIELGSALPPISDGIRLNGRECETEAGVLGPCAEVDGVSSDPVLTVEEVEDVEIEGLALTNAEMGIETDASPRLKVRNSWLGVSLDGSAAGNDTGIRLGPGSNSSRIGGEGPGTGNLIANTAGTGLDILGSSNVRVLGNEFGVGPGGDQPASNGGDIVIASTAGEADAVGNTIGTRVSAAAAASSQCELGCNLISGADSNGIDLSGAGEGDPPIATTITGNHFGFDRAGTATIANAEASILVDGAAQTVVGGAKAGDANRFAGGTAAVLAGPAAADLIVRGNLIGSSAGGTVEPPEDGIVASSEGLTTPAVEALIAANEIGLEGGIGISHEGFGARISGNRVHGAATGIRIHGSTESQGNLIEGNSIEMSEGVGILVENDFNEIVGNRVLGAGEAGVRIAGSPPFGVNQNLVGGDTAASENTIVGSDGPAIQISNVEFTQTEVARNRGAENAGLFIALAAFSPETEPIGPNGGIEPPAIFAVSPGGAEGTGEPGAKVRVFRKLTLSAGEIESFLGQAVADEEGVWRLVFPAPLAPGTAVGATQTSEAGGTSELAIAEVPAAAQAGDPEANPPVAAGPSDRTPPQTKILRQPKRVSKARSVRFAFSADEQGSRFQCSLDGNAFRGCKSPKRYQKMQPGKHEFRVRAIDPAGNVDRTPAKRRFEVVG